MVSIKINTEQVRDVGQQLRSMSDQVQDIQSTLRGAINSLDTWAWDGRSRADAEPLLSETHPRSGDISRDLERFGQMLRVVANRFEGEDTSAAETMGNLPWVNFSDGSEIFYPTHLPASEFPALWESWTISERWNFLKEVYSDLVRQCGLDKLSIEVDQLEDGSFLLGLVPSDALGVNRGTEIAIDIDNLRGADGVELVKTVIHETRHQIQRELVKSYLVEGDSVRLPSDISLEQVKQWEVNLREGNYIEPDNILKLQQYLKQPVEQDARDFADVYIDEVLTK